MQTSRLGDGAEFDLIRRFLAAHDRYAGHAGAVRVGPGDDCAVISAGDVALSTDMAVEGVHFRRDWLTPEEVGYRAAAAALSDLAAVAAAPVGVLVSVALTAADAGDYGVAVMKGVYAAAAHVGASVLGGDVSRAADALVIDVVAVGTAPRPVLRSGALPGDGVYVTGRLGGAAAAVHAWQHGTAPDPAARRAFAAPRPRTVEALWLLEHAQLHAMIDVSDGLAGDCAHVAAASDVAIILDLASVPLHPALHALDAGAAQHFALHGGEDYELCFTAAAAAIEPLVEPFTARFDTPLTRVGTVEAGHGVHRRVGDRTVPLQGGYDHFVSRT